MHNQKRWLVAWLSIVGCMGCASSEVFTSELVKSAIPARTDTSVSCQGNCDATPLSTPVIAGDHAWGSVTTYGSVGNPTPSAGGACNYGKTGVLAYAAIQVSQLPGDGKGQWDGGKICGQCALVRARTDSGWKETMVRIMDKCPDDHCGIDLGGLPAKELMGTQAGRYSGEWTLVSCEGHPSLFDGPTALWVKEGSSQWWSIVQVRNPKSAVTALRMRRSTDSLWTAMAWATEAENFFRIPSSILKDSTADYELEVEYHQGVAQRMTVPGFALSRPDTSIPLP